VNGVKETVGTVTVKDDAFFFIFNKHTYESVLLMWCYRSVGRASGLYLKTEYQPHLFFACTGAEGDQSAKRKILHAVQKTDEQQAARPPRA
jgi:hypothetical protein